MQICIPIQYHSYIIPQNEEKVKMKHELLTKYSQFPLALPQLSLVSAAQTAELLLAVNAETAVHGLFLTESEAHEVAEARRESLLASGRVDFAGDLPAKIARAFCDSPNIHQSQWAETIAGLVDLFYDIKNTYDPTAYALADDALIARMRRWFDDPAGGSLDQLADLLQTMAERLQWGVSPDEPDRRGAILDGLDTRDWLSRRPATDFDEDERREFPLSDILDAD